MRRGDPLSACFLFMGAVAAIVCPAHVAAAEDDQPKRSVAQFDKPTDYYFDLTREGDKKPTWLKFTAPAKFWADSDGTFIAEKWASVARKGTGHAWTYVDNADAGRAQGRAFLDVLGVADDSEGDAAARLDAAVAAWIEGLAETVKASDSELLTSLDDVDVNPVTIRLGKSKTRAVRFGYNITPMNTVQKNVVFRGSTLAFEHRGFVVFLTTEVMRVAAFEPFAMQPLSLTDEPYSKKARTVDLREMQMASDGQPVARHLVFDLPARFERSHAELEVGLHATYVRRNKKGVVEATLQVRSRASGPSTDVAEDIKLMSRLAEVHGDGTEGSLEVGEPFELDGRTAVPWMLRKGDEESPETVFTTAFKMYDRVFQIDLTVPLTGKPAEKLKKQLLDKGVFKSLVYWFDTF